MSSFAIFFKQSFATPALILASSKNRKCSATPELIQHPPFLTFNKIFIFRKKISFVCDLFTKFFICEVDQKTEERLNADRYLKVSLHSTSQEHCRSVYWSLLTLLLMVMNKKVSALSIRDKFKYQSNYQVRYQHR